MTTNLTSTEPASYAEVLTQAAIAFRDNHSNRPTAQSVVEALLQAEKAAKHHHLTYPLEALAGKWRLCFTATRQAHYKAGKLTGRGWYMPKFSPAYISLYPNAAEGTSGTGKIGNQIQFGPILFKIDGPLKYLGKKNLLAFDFTQAQLDLLGKTIYSGGFRGGKAKQEEFANIAIAKLPFFAFFLVTENFVAARGRGGGLALWIRES